MSGTATIGVDMKAITGAFERVGKRFQKYKTVNMLKLVAIAIGVLVTSATIGGIVGKKLGDENCDCLKPSDAGWRAFSITQFVATIILIPVVLKFGWMCFQG
jgi:hypothetical protein